MQQMNFGLAVKLAREHAGWSVRKLAEEAGVSPSAISLIENNQREMSIHTAMAVANALGITLSSLTALAEDADTYDIRVRELKKAQQDLIGAALNLRHQDAKDSDTVSESAAKRASQRA